MLIVYFDACCLNRPFDDQKQDRVRLESEAVLLISAFDALHVACAERAGADLLLTTDERLIRTARRASGSILTEVENPLRWLNERSEP